MEAAPQFCFARSRMRRCPDRVMARSVDVEVSIDIAERNGSLLRRWLRSATA